MPVTLETLVEPAVLRIVWKDIRSRDRQVHLTQSPLMKDSTGGVAFELSLKEALQYLNARVLDGTYRPHPPLVVEASKSRLLRRRLSFLSLEDALVLGVLVQAARPALMAKMPEWVSFGRLDEDTKQPRRSQKKRIITFDYEGWWTKWLKYMKLLKVIENDLYPLLVTSDVVNFFGSVDLSLLRGRVSGTTSLDNKSNDLLFYLLDRLRPDSSYGPRGSFGLPVVADDTSRVLAHFYLCELDNELLPEGRKNRYTRWVDDMAVSVPNLVEGGKVVARIERALSRIGLVANASKTDILRKTDFRKQHHEEHNEYLDGIHDMTDKGMKLSPADRRKFKSRLSDFLSSERQGYWSRVLRRYYTESRRVNSKALLRVWSQHLREFPSDAQSILDYTCFFPGDIEFCEKLFEYLRADGPLFEDVQILSYEALLAKPFPNEPVLRAYIVRQTYNHFLGKGGFEEPTGYVKGLQALAIYKFGGSRAVRLLAPRFPSLVVASPIFATYALGVVAANDALRRVALTGVEHIEDSRILRIRALIQRLENGDDRAIALLLGLLEPKLTKLPTRALVNSRALPFIPIALRSRLPVQLKRVNDSLARVAIKLRTSGPPALVDGVTLSHLELP